MSFGHASWLLVLQSFPIPFLFVPMTLAGYVGLAAEKTNAAAGMMNFMRNIGQSIGTSAMTTVLARRDHFHSICPRAIHIDRTIPDRHSGTRSSTEPRRSEPPLNAESGDGQALQHGSVAGGRALLCRCVLASGNYRRDHVRRIVPAQTERSAQEWECCHALRNVASARFFKASKASNCKMAKEESGAKVNFRFYRAHKLIWC
jgi:hypothetical protein